MHCQNKEVKDRLLDICNERRDSLAEEALLRIQDSLSDLHAVKAQYHGDCFKEFTSKCNILVSTHPLVKEEIDTADYALNHAIKKLKEITPELELY